MNFERHGLSETKLLHLYESLLLPRMIEEKMLLLLRQGKVSKWFSGIGQEAIAVGATQALRSDDFILPLHRNLGVFTSRHMPLQRLFAQWQGKALGYTNGRDRSFHFGSVEHHIVGMISHLGAMLGVADGLALAAQLKQTGQLALVFSGDGGASEGDFHEAINIAAVWGLPVIFLIENNGYGLSTPSNEQFKCASFADKAIGYGIQGYSIDGNNLLEVYHTVSRLAEEVRATQKPVILEARTFRMRGHEEASGTKYVPQALFDAWQPKCPVYNYENYLLQLGLVTPQKIEALKQAQKQTIQHAWDDVFAEPDITPSLEKELNDVYAISTHAPVPPKFEQVQTLRFVDALSEGLAEAMQHDSNLILMGQDIANYGGVFKVTQGFVERFGKERVRNTPLCESGIIGAGLGLAIAGYPSVIEMQFADFVSCGFNQIVNNLAKTHYRWGQPVNVTIRMPTGAGTGAGPFHSQSNEAWFTKVPGLRVVYPSTPMAAKGLIAASVLEPNPVIFFEHKLLYRSLEGDVPQGYYTLPIGQAQIARIGSDVTLVTYGMGVVWAKQLQEKMPDVDIEIIDLQTLLPWDVETVSASVRKTSRCLVLHEDTLTCGFGAEIAAFIGEHCFEYLDAPVMRVGSLDTPVPFYPALEKQFLAKNTLEQRMRQLMAY